MSAETTIGTGSGTKKRRRQRKRSRKSTLKKSSGGEEVNSNNDAEDLQNIPLNTTDNSSTDTNDIFTKNYKDISEEHCGCKKKQDGDRTKRRRSRRHKKKLGLLDILSCESMIDDYTTEDCFSTQSFEFEIPAFKVHQRCEHPMYLPESIKFQGTEPLISHSTEPEDGNNSSSTCTSNKRSKFSSQHSAVDSNNIAVVVEDERTPVPVSSVEEVNVGDIIYFDQLTLRGSEPIIERKKAKVFLIMKDDGTSKNSSILLRTYVGFDALNPATWNPKKDSLSSEPFIVRFEDLHGISKMRSNL